MDTNLLIESFRGDLSEKAHFGWILVVNNNQKVLSSLSNQNYSCYLRSCEKPFQAVVSLEAGVIDKFNLSLSDVALAFASHTGSMRHIQQIQIILDKLKLSETDLLCGLHNPFDIHERHKLIHHNSSPSVLHNNCSGKHIFLIAACLAQKLDFHNYNDPDHPIQKRIEEFILEYCKPVKLFTGVDGCGLPVHGMTLVEMASGFAKLFDGTNKEAEIIAEAITKYPINAGGINRIDSMIIQQSEGKIIAKVGAEGLLILTRRHSGESLIVKVLDGNNDIRNLITVEALKQIGWIDSSNKYDQLLETFYRKEIMNLNNKIVGHHQIHFSL